MAAFVPSAQGVEGTLKIEWDDLFHMLKPFDVEGKKIYGIPKGGMIATAFLQHAQVVHRPELADLLLDDIEDSGLTHSRTRLQFPDKPFSALIVKGESMRGTWVVMPWESDAVAKPEDHVVRLLQYIGENPLRDGLKGTPRRVVQMLTDMTSSTRIDDTRLNEVLSSAFECVYDELIVLTGVRFACLCEHHLMPFAGTVDVGYLPGQRVGVTQKVVGISKLARLIIERSKRLQIQERLTQSVASAIRDTLGVSGVGVIVRAHHSCMGCRGVTQPDTIMVTSSMLGSFREDATVRAEFLRLVDSGRSR